MNNPHLVQNYCYSGMLACVWALTWERRDLIWNLISCHVSSVHLNMSSECESGRELVRDLSKKNGNLRDQEGFEIKGAITSHGRALLWTERRGYDPCCSPVIMWVELHTEVMRRTEQLQLLRKAAVWVRQSWEVEALTKTLWKFHCYNKRICRVIMW